jgi:hypothetical protein
MMGPLLVGYGHPKLRVADSVLDRVRPAVRQPSGTTLLQRDRLLRFLNELFETRVAAQRIPERQ